MDAFKGHLPLYLQLKKVLRDRISHGVYAVGTNIPPENRLEEEFGVSKITVRNAVKELVQEGFLQKRSGKGTTVIHHTSMAKLTKGKRFTELLVDEGHRLEKQLVSVGEETLADDSELAAVFGASCVKIERVYYLDDQPYIYFIHYLTPEMRGVDESSLAQRSMYELIAESDIYMETFRDRFAVSHAPERIMRTLEKSAEEAIFKRIRRSYDDKGYLVELSEGFYDTDVQSYIVDYEA